MLAHEDTTWREIRETEIGEKERRREGEKEREREREIALTSPRYFNYLSPGTLPGTEEAIANIDVRWK